MYYLDHSDSCVHLGYYLHNVSTDLISNLLQVYLVERGNFSVKLMNLHRISNKTLYLTHKGNMFSFYDQIAVLHSSYS